MKTPQEILFARHQSAAGPRLDAIRREVVAELNHQGTKAQSWTKTLVSWCLGCSNKLWLELVWPCRRIWAGLAAVWILIFVFNFSQRDPAEMLARKSSPPSPRSRKFSCRDRAANAVLKLLPCSVGAVRRFFEPQARRYNKLKL